MEFDTIQIKGKKELAMLIWMSLLSRCSTTPHYLYSLHHQPLPFKPIRIWSKMLSIEYTSSFPFF